jgi:hypothetical protein
MNERIRQLAEQAGIKITPMVVDGVEYEYEDVDMDGSEDLAKFAQLIVKKCAYLVNHQQRTTGYTTHAKMLCEEFGIEFKDEDFFGVQE